MSAAENLALDFAKTAAQQDIDRNRTRRAVIEGVTEMLEELISKHSSALDTEKAERLIRTALLQLNPLLERTLGPLPVVSSGQEKVINKQASFATYQAD